jgi:hypothetical protein
MSAEELQREKKRLIGRFLKLQDMIEQYNGEVYRLCCQIEALNLLIEKKEKFAGKAAANGHAPS